MGCNQAELSLWITTDAEIQEINRRWLHRNRPTDVLAFSQREGIPMPSPLLGDIVISLETAERQAKELGHSLELELWRLLAHGMLHLLGYEHTKGGRAAQKMRTKEEELTALVQEKMKP